MSSSNVLAKSSAATGPASSCPFPDAAYNEIIQDSVLFFQKLYNFHASFGSANLKIPTIKGSTLDLHRLFVEVTSRGGFEKVVADRKWKEICQAFKYPSTMTSAPHNIKKQYQLLLCEFEQVYYFQKKTFDFETDSVNTSVNNSSAGNHEDSAAMHHLLANSTLKPGCSINGTIDAKCEWGYLISVDLGHEQLHGVMFHVPEVTCAVDSQSQSQRRFRDPSGTGESTEYHYFYEEFYDKLKPLYGEHGEDMNKKIWLMWNRLSEAEKQEWRR